MRSTSIKSRSGVTQQALCLLSGGFWAAGGFYVVLAYFFRIEETRVSVPFTSPRRCLLLSNRSLLLLVKVGCRAATCENKWVILQPGAQHKAPARMACRA